MIATLRSASVLALAAAALAASAQSTVFYGGDYAPAGALLSFRNDTAGMVTVYDDFTLTQSVNIVGLFGEYYVSGVTPVGLGYEIRQGMSAGNGGTLLATGTATGVAATQVGTTAAGYMVDRVSGSVSGVTLGPGTYFLGLYARMPGTTVAFLTTTFGANAIGSPINDGNAFIEDPGISDFASTTSTYGADYHDFSIGVVAQPAPEPSALAALGIGAVAVLRRRRRA